MLEFEASGCGYFHSFFQRSISPTAEKQVTAAPNSCAANVDCPWHSLLGAQEAEINKETRLPKPCRQLSLAMRKVMVFCRPR